MTHGSYFQFDIDKKTKYKCLHYHYKRMDEFKSHRPLYCIPVNSENRLNLKHTLGRIKLTSIVYENIKWHSTKEPRIPKTNLIDCDGVQLHQYWTTLPVYVYILPKARKITHTYISTQSFWMGTEVTRNKHIANPQVPALIPRPAINRTARMCQRHGSNQTPTLLFESKLISQSVHRYKICGRGDFAINNYKPVILLRLQ